jgi:peptidoglycan/xylan/chitin deacetylase (PgdA/CDA1 family)
MPAERRPGMDNPYYSWSPMITRPTLRWPNQAPVALSVILSLDQMELDAPAGSLQSPVLAGGLGQRPYPDFPRQSHREYGHRVGIFRVLDVLEARGVPATVAVDALTAEGYPALMTHLHSRGCEIIAHGISASQMISSRMTEEDERAYIKRSIDACAAATGAAPAGWLGPEYGESERTPALLAEAGLSYVCDWTNDEQPYPMTTPHGELHALPLLWDLDDVNALWDRRLTTERYGRALVEAFDTLQLDGATNARLLALHLHPWLIGQPFRVGYLDAALAEIMSRNACWPATASQVIERYRSHPPGT